MIQALCNPAKLKALLGEIQVMLFIRLVVETLAKGISSFCGPVISQ